MVVSVVQLKAHLNLTTDDDDGLLSGKIDAAERKIQEFTGRALDTETLKATFDRFPRAIRLPRSPVQSVTSITYLDGVWEQQTLAPEAYFVTPLNVDRPAFVYPARGTCFPETARLAGSVTVTYKAGYADYFEVPRSLVEAVLQLAAHLYENREATLVGVNAQELPFGVYDLIRDFRDWEF